MRQFAESGKGEAYGKIWGSGSGDVAYKDNCLYRDKATAVEFSLKRELGRF